MTDRERTGLLETFQEEGFGAGLGQTLDMFTPQAGRPGTDLGTLFSDFVNFSPVGDVMDVREGLDFSNDLDPLERGLALLPLLGTTAVGWHAGKHLAKKGDDFYRAARARLNEQVAPGQAMTPPQGQPIPGRFDEVDPLEVADDPESRQMAIAGWDQARLDKIVPGRAAIQDAGNFAELAHAIEASDGQWVAGNLEVLGRMIVARTPDGRYGTPDSNGAVAATEVQELAAAQNAVLRWKVAEEKYGFPPIADMAFDSMSLPQLVDFEIQASQWSVGPDLSPHPGYSLVPVLTDEGVDMYMGVNVLPQVELYNPDTGELNEQALYQAQKLVDPQSAVGPMAANIATALQGPQGQLGKDWYWQANRMIRVLADAPEVQAVGVDTSAISSVFAAGSTNTRWLWPNVVGGIHRVLEHAKIDPARHRQLFLEAVEAGGWKDDLWAATGKSLKDATGSPDALLEHFSDPNNLRTANGLPAFAMEGQKSQSQAALDGIAPEMIFQTAKLGNFATNMGDPDLARQTTIDRHTAGILIGDGQYKGLPDAKASGKKITDAAIDAGVELPSGETITRAKVERQVKDYISRHGVTEEVARKAVYENIGSIQSAAYRAWYDAGVEAHSAVRQFAPEYTTNNQVQAAPWPIRSETANSFKDLQKRWIGGTLSPEEWMDAIRGEHYNSQFLDTLGGYSSVTPTVMSYLNRASADLNVSAPSLAGFSPSGKFPTPGNPIVLHAGESGVEVYAHLDTPGVREAARHLVPTRFTVAGENGEVYTRMVPRTAQQVDSVRDHLGHIQSQLAPDGQPMFGEARVWVGPEQPSSLLNGNRIEFDDVDLVELTSQLDEANLPAMTVKEIRHERHVLGRGRRADIDLSQVSDLNSPQGPIGTQHWHAVSGFQGDRSLVANREANRRMRAEIERAGGTVYDGNGTWRKEPQPEFAEPDPAKVNPDVADVAERYMRSAGMPYEPATLATEVDEGRAMRIADEYDAMPELSEDALQSYEAFKREVTSQYEALVDAGYTIVPVVDDPYGSAAPSREMFADVRDNKRIQFFLTDLDDMPAGHPMAEQSGVVIGGQSLSFNDLFRAIHDVYGHARNSNQFGALGEENAWRTHMAMFSKEAQPAMTAETRGQNSWVNFGAPMRSKEGRVIRKGEPGYVSPKDRPFAAQKASLLPSEYSQVDQPGTPVMEGEESFVVFGLSNSKMLQIAKKYGQQGVATPEAMLFTDGTYAPATGNTLYGNEAINSPEGQTVVDVNGRKMAFATEYDWDGVTELADPDSLMAVPRTEQGSTVVVKVGDAVSSLAPSQVRKVLEIGRKSARATRAHLHGAAWQDADLVPVYESTFTDRAGQTLTYASGQAVDANNQAVMYVPRGESYRYSTEGNEVLKARRTVAETRRIAEYTDDNRVMVDGDVEIRYRPDATVSRTKEGNLLGFKVNGSVPRRASVDMTEGLPVIRVDDTGIGDPRGRFVNVELTRGAVTKITAFDLNDVNDAVEVLGKAGAIIPEKIQVEETGRRKSGDSFGRPYDYVKGPLFTPEHAAMFDLPPEQTETPIDVEVAQLLPEERKFQIRFDEWGVRHPESARRIGQELFGYFPGASFNSASTRFAEVYGDLPAEILDEAPWGFRVVNTQGVGGMAHFRGESLPHRLGIMFDDSMLQNAQQNGGRLAETMADGEVIPPVNQVNAGYEAYLVNHEFGHFVEGIARKHGYADRINSIQRILRQRMDDARIEMGDYSRGGLHERWAESWAWAVMDPEGAPGPVRDAVREVVSILNSIYTESR